MREVVAPQGVSSQYIYCLVENLLHEISKLRISAVSRCHRKFFVFLERRSTYSEQKDNATRQMVSYLGLTTMAKKVVAVAYESLSFTRGSSYRSLNEKIWVFWIAC